MIGERIRLAREACRLTQHELADLSEVPPGTVSRIESGSLNPSGEAVERIAAATGFATSFFYRGPLPDVDEGFFRRLKKGSAKDAKQFRAQVRQVVELVQIAEGQLKLPPVTVKPVRDVCSLDEVEEIAQEVRAYLGVGSRDPIPNFIRAIERAGVVVVRLPTHLDDHDGFSVWPDSAFDGRPVIAITAGHPGDRDRANIGHELGHLVLHTYRRNIDPDIAEREAWRFAGALLLPREAAEEIMTPPITLQTLKGVKAHYGTSIAFNIKRARDLDLIGQQHYVSLRKQLHARGWYKTEPVEVTSEKPVLMPKIVDCMAGEGSLKEQSERIGVQRFLIPALES